MKKVFSIILITILMFVLCACGSIDNKNNTLADNTPQDIQEEVKQHDEQQTEPLKEEELVITQVVPCMAKPAGEIVAGSKHYKRYLIDEKHCSECKQICQLVKNVKINDSAISDCHPGDVYFVAVGDICALQENDKSAYAYFTCDVKDVPFLEDCTSKIVIKYDYLTTCETNKAVIGSLVSVKTEEIDSYYAIDPYYDLNSVIAKYQYFVEKKDISNDFTAFYNFASSVRKELAFTQPEIFPVHRVNYSKKLSQDFIDFHIDFLTNLPSDITRCEKLPECTKAKIKFNGVIWLECDQTGYDDKSFIDDLRESFMLTTDGYVVYSFWNDGRYVLIKDKGFCEKFKFLVDQLYQIPDPVITWKGNRDELTGLTLQSPPEEVELLYSKALRAISICEFCSWSYEGDYSVDKNDSITINNQTYYALKDDEGKNLTSLKDYFSEVFTKEPAEKFANRYLNLEFYTEKDGKVYFYDCGGGRGSNISLLWDKVAGFAKIDDAHALMQVETAFGERWIDNEYITAKDVVEEYVEDIYHLVLEDGTWKFDDVISYYP